MEFTLSLYSRLDDYQVATFMRCFGTEALNMHSSLLFASKEEKGRIDEVLEKHHIQNSQYYVDQLFGRTLQGKTLWESSCFKNALHELSWKLT